MDLWGLGVLLSGARHLATYKMIPELVKISINILSFSSGD